jgi:hypothetical protein
VGVGKWEKRAEGREGKVTRRGVKERGTEEENIHRQGRRSTGDA